MTQLTHLKTLLVKGCYKDDLSFEFKQFTTNELLKIIKELPSKKPVF